MPTLIGALFLIGGLVCFWRKDESLFALVIFSSIFQGASMTTSGSLGLQPYYLIAILFVAQSVLLMSKTSTAPVFKGRIALLMFGTIAFVSAFTLPIVFAGVPVYEKSVGIDDGFFYRPPLTFSLSNVTQAVFLVINILLVISAGKRICNSKLPILAFRFAFYFLVIVIVCQVLCSALNIPFPDKLLLNNPGYAFQDSHEGGISLRAPGTFSESSFAGVFIAMSCAAFLGEFFQTGVGVFRVLLAILALFFIRSTSSFLTIPLVLIPLMFRYPVIYGTGYVKIAQLRKIMILVAILGIAFAFVFLSSLGTTTVLSIVGKGDSSSFINRSAADLHALNLLIMSKGFGVGLGSNRPSSIVASLLSNTGVAGFLTFTIMFIQIVCDTKDRFAWIRWAGLGLILDMAFGVPDIGFPPLWVLLALAVRTREMRDPQAEYFGDNIQVLRA